MIEFEHKLPLFNIDGKPNGQYNNPELLVPGLLTTKDFRLGEFLHVKVYQKTIYDCTYIVQKVENSGEN